MLLAPGRERRYRQYTEGMILDQTQISALPPWLIELQIMIMDLLLQTRPYLLKRGGPC